MTMPMPGQIPSPPGYDRDRLAGDMFRLTQLSRQKAAFEAVQQRRSLTQEEIEKLESLTAQCTHCGGWHDRACPRVKRLFWHPNGQLARVDYWPYDKIDTTGVVWGDTEEPGPPDEEPGSDEYPEPPF